MFVPPTNIEEVNQKRKWEGEEATGRKRLRSVEPEMLSRPETRKPGGEKKEKEETEKEKEKEGLESGATWAGGFSAFANGPSGFGTFKPAEKKEACTCLDKYEGLTGKVVNGRFVPNVGQSTGAGAFGAGFNFSGYRESGSGGTFGAGFRTRPGKEEKPKSGNGGIFGAGFGMKPKEEKPKPKQPEQEQPKQEKPKEQKSKEEHPKNETPKAKQKKSSKPEEKPKAWAKVETEYVEPEEKKPKKQNHRNGEYHNENLASKIKIPNYGPKPAPRPEKRKGGDSDSNTFKSFDSLFEPSEPLNRKQKKPGVKGKINLKISEMFDTVRGEKVARFASQEYRDWVKACMAFFGQQKTTTADAGMNTASTTSTTSDLKFPKITRGFCKLEARECVKGELFDCCQHDVQRCLRGSGVNTEGEPWLEKLKKERVRWHPDKFAHKMGKKFEKEAQEFFQILQALVKKAEKELGK